MDCCK